MSKTEKAVDRKGSVTVSLSVYLRRPPTLSLLISPVFRDLNEGDASSALCSPSWVCPFRKHKPDLFLSVELWWRIEQLMCVYNFTAFLR